MILFIAEYGWLRPFYLVAQNLIERNCYILEHSISWASVDIINDDDRDDHSVRRSCNNSNYEIRNLIIFIEYIDGGSEYKTHICYTHTYDM